MGVEQLVTTFAKKKFHRKKLIILLITDMTT